MNATLFDTEPEAGERTRVDPQTGKTLARLHQVKELVEWGYDAEVVCDWTYEKAAQKLTARRAEAKLAIARAKAKAATIDYNAPPPDDREFKRFPAAAEVVLAPAERADAARAVEQALAEGSNEEVQFAVQGAVWCMDEDRVRSLAGYIVRVLKGE